MTTKKNLSENYDEDWVYEFDKNIPIRDQAIYSDDHYLLNVRKIFTNDVYFGVEYTTLDDYGNLYHQFRCKDRRFLEHLVDDRASFLNLYFTKKDDHLILASQSNYKSKKASFFTNYNLTFYYDDSENYSYSTITFNKGLFKGIYGSSDLEGFKTRTKSNGFSVLNREPTKQEVKEHLIDKAKISFSNVITRVNTAYSNIKVFHKTEI